MRGKKNIVEQSTKKFNYWRMGFLDSFLNDNFCSTLSIFFPPSPSKPLFYSGEKRRKNSFKRKN
jgi:hypothetical protein